MRLARLLAALLCCGLLPLVPAAPALGQGAAAVTTRSVPAGSSDKTPPLTVEPQASGGSAGRSKHPSRPHPDRSAGNHGGASSGPTALGRGPGAAAPRLPTTGADLPGVAFLGLALVLLGIGLRLRTADVRP